MENTDGKDMYTRTRNRAAFAIVVLLALVIVLCVVGLLFVRPRIKKQEELDPHAGQVYINDGFDMVWMTPYENVPANTLERADISFSGARPVYTGSAYKTLYGVDVSEHQWNVEWDKVAASGVDFAMIRLGYRGFTEGGLFIDPYFERNMTQAAANGLEVGVYFFSQALSVQEALEEAELVLKTLEGYNVTMPVVYDWEKIESDTVARTEGMDSTILTDCAVAFCQTVKNAGYDAAVYFNRHFGYYEYDLSRLTNYKFWIALPGDFPDFYYRFDIWQYSFDSLVPGIEGGNDMNMLFIPLESPQEQKN